MYNLCYIFKRLYKAAFLLVVTEQNSKLNCLVTRGNTLNIYKRYTKSICLIYIINKPDIEVSLLELNYVMVTEKQVYNIPICVDLLFRAKA
jgi:hypothetical protein